MLNNKDRKQLDDLKFVEDYDHINVELDIETHIQQIKENTHDHVNLIRKKIMMIQKIAAIHQHLKEKEESIKITKTELDTPINELKKINNNTQNETKIIIKTVINHLITLRDRL